jgi:hypothetical protein
MSYDVVQTQTAQSVDQLSVKIRSRTRATHAWENLMKTTVGGGLIR